MQQSSWKLLPWGLVCIAVGYLYSGGPWPISATPFGEFAAGSCMGLGVIAISYFIHTKDIPYFIFLVSAAPSVMIGAILMANNIRDFNDDKAHGRKTLAILVGKKNAVRALEAMFLFAYLWTVGLVFGWQASPWILLVLLSLPKVVQATRGFRQGTRPQELMAAMVATAQANTAFGLLLALGLLIEHF
jgi:1,4-dihydroxy-2-naphthoate octaprenyltransferase